MGCFALLMIQMVQLFPYSHGARKNHVYLFITMLEQLDGYWKRGHIWVFKRWGPLGVGTHFCRHDSTDEHQTTAKLAGACRDAASCSHDWVTLSIRVVKRGCECTLCLSPPTGSVWRLCGVVTHTMLLFWPQLTWGERTLVRYTSQVRDDFYTWVIRWIMFVLWGNGIL